MAHKDMTRKGILTSVFVGAASGAAVILGYTYGDANTVAPISLLGMAGYVAAMAGGMGAYMTGNNRGLYPAFAAAACSLALAVGMVVSPPSPQTTQRQVNQQAPR